MHRHRNFLLLAALMLVLSVLSACGNSNSAAPANEPAATTAPSESSAETSDSAATINYTDSLGREVVIPAHPQRIITTQYLPEMIAAGTKPIGAVTHLLNNFVSIKDQIGGIEDVGPANAINMEKVLSLQPDLIIATEMDKDKIDELNKIAPTVAVQWVGNDAFKHFTDVAAVIGKSAEADQWIADFNKESEQARQELASSVQEGETFGAVVIGGYEKGQLRVYGPGNVGYTLYDTLHFKMTDFVKHEWETKDHELGLNISLEKLPEYASADRIFLVKFKNDPEFLQEVENSRLWNNLPAVKNNKVYVVDEALWFSYDVMSLKGQLENAVELLKK
ncbi:ABC transporter substrate-binding protein [Paenibacillus sp. NPDC058177]|uniref:ABC transporter substrate-binding protein n=1 Tax=Paenibacillus sp. NPDC058177 TaxID=3346369 RepID=UPI0036DCE7AC